MTIAVAFCAACGSDDDRAAGPQPERGATETQESSAEAPDLARGRRPSARDREVARGLRRVLRQEAAGVASGWRYADVQQIQVRGTEVVVVTRLGPGRREAATSLCLAARRFFLTAGQGQTPYHIVVAGGDRATLARC